MSSRMAQLLGIPSRPPTYNLIISSRGEHNFAQEVDFSPNGKILYVSRGDPGRHRRLQRRQEDDAVAPPAAEYFGPII